MDKIIKLQKSITKSFLNNQILYLIIIISAIWMIVYNKTSIQKWQLPVDYTGDSLLVLGILKAYSSEGLGPIAQKFILGLNAPFTANWNDYPITEDFLFSTFGFIARFLGVMTTANAALLIAHILAGVSFYLVGRYLRYDRFIVFASALVFSMSNFIFQRSFPHIVLSYYWHIPLLLLVSYWAWNPHRLVESKRILATSTVIMIISGLQNPYYTFLAMHFMAFATARQMVLRHYASSMACVFLLLVLAGSFLTVSSNTILFQMANGPNHEAVVRSLSSLELYGLKITELFAPIGSHRWSWWARIWQDRYYDKALIRGEMGSPYIGLVGIFGLFLLVATSIYHLFKNDIQKVTNHFWQLTWIIIYGSVGGLSILFGVMGIILFRGTNRWSIFINAMALLFLAGFLSKNITPRARVIAAIAIALIGLWDQLPPLGRAAVATQIYAPMVASDRQYTQALDAVLPKGAMVFQLPVMDFPEVPPIHQMTDYEHFRPYILSDELRFSYGANKGRGDNE